MNRLGDTTNMRSADPRQRGTDAGAGISRRRFIAAGAAVLGAPLAARSAFAQAKVLRISTPGSPDEWQSKGLVKFKEELERSAAGQFNVQLHFNGTLFAQGTEIEAMQRGNLEGALTSPQDITNLIPEYSIFTTGYLMRGPAHLDAVYDGDIGAEYKARVAKQVGIQIVRSQYLGTRHVILRQPRSVQTPADMAGLKLRMPGSETWQFLGAALGANPTPLAFEEVYLAMQTGTVDGLENPLPDAMAAKFYEVSKQVVLTGHMVANVFFTLAGGFWNGLAPAQQKLIEGAIAASKKVNDDGVVETEKTAVSFFEGKGVKVTTPDVGAFRSQVQKRFLDSKFAKTWPPGLLDRINKAGA